MPLYTFKHPENDEYVEVVQRMNDEHSYVDPDGLKWKRVFHVPQMAMATKIDPFSQAQFVRSGDGKNDTIGDMWDRSKEMSERRAEQNGGVDPVREKALKDYSKERGGAKHPSEFKKKIVTKDVTVDFTTT